MVLAYVAAAYAALTVVLTYPAVAHLGEHMIGDGGDGQQFAWNLWWMKRALLDLHTTPFQTGAIFHPTGVSLWLHTLSPLNGVLFVPTGVSSFGHFTRSLWTAWSGNATENACFLGFTVLALPYAFFHRFVPPELTAFRCPRE
ncbi:MAG TPA: hypothetical protein VK540_09815 [Polyangiaceae bacterium]|nr:hypothetical protein [Polyangiaceae bacterium]